LRFIRHVCRTLLRLLGWTAVWVPPSEPKGIIIVYPHTSNWDFILGVLFRVGYDLKAHWMGKDAMFRWPVAGLYRRIGGIPINRRERTGFIGVMVEEFRKRDWLWVAIAPEGTRTHTDHLKSGFYHLALAANVPVGLGCIDYGRRRISIDTYVRFSGEVEHDLEILRHYYSDKRGRVPANAGDIRFRH
jgi:1-acyl-sn-glycerol-3-phosphate acyltransferase